MKSAKIRDSKNVQNQAARTQDAVEVLAGSAVRYPLVPMTLCVIEKVLKNSHSVF